MTRYSGPDDYQHGSVQQIGVLLVNLGTPDDPGTPAVRRFLAEFLSDPRVVEFPRGLWWLILHGVILRFRPGRVARAYQSIWTEQGSPLLDIGRRQAAALQSRLDAVQPGLFRVELAMRYGSPSIATATEALRRDACRHMVLLPLFPQYSATTGATVFDEVARCLVSWRLMPSLRSVMNYHDHDRYIEALARSVEDHWQSQGRAQKLLMSFHGLPQRYLKAGDPYYCECHKTARLLAQRLKLQSEQWELAFQSRMGREPWLQPYLDKRLKALPKQGVESVDVVCPGFAADCLETLEEVAMQNRELFLSSGGREYHYIPALNDAPDHIDLLSTLVREQCHGWIDSIRNYNDKENLERSRQLASLAGA